MKSAKDKVLIVFFGKPVALFDVDVINYWHVEAINCLFLIFLL